MAWLDDLIKQTRETESPSRYYWWAGIATIAGTVAKNVWLVRGGRWKLYPNVYVALISASGTKKGEPIRVAKELADYIDCIRVISGCNSIQGLIHDLGQLGDLGHGKPKIKEAHGFLISGEFATFLTNDPMALDTLTDLFSTHENDRKWEKKLKSGPLTLVSPCLSLLIASNERMLDTQVKPKDIEGGFIARTFIVKENKPSKPNALVDEPKNPLDIPGLAKRLTEIHSIKGEFKWDEDARLKWKYHYEEFARYDEIEDHTGTYGRIGEQILKVAMLISLSRKNDLVLEWQDVEMAIEKVEECAFDATRMTPSNELSNGDRPNAMKYVIECLINSHLKPDAPKLTKMAMLRKLHQFHINTPMVDACISHLLSMDFVTVENPKSRDNSKIIFSLTEAGEAQFCSEAKKHYQKKRLIN